MVRTAFVSVVALAASANAFLAPVPGYSLARTSRASGEKRSKLKPFHDSSPSSRHVAIPTEVLNMYYVVLDPIYFLRELLTDDSERLQ